MTSPINSSNFHNYDVNQAHSHSHSAEKTGGSSQPKTGHVEHAQQNQNTSPPLDPVHGHGGHHGGGGGHSKITEVQGSEKSFRSHFRHMKSPHEVINQQKMLRELELKEQLAKEIERKNKSVEVAKQSEKKNIKSNDQDKNKDQQEKKKKRGFFRKFLNP